MTIPPPNGETPNDQTAPPESGQRWGRVPCWWLEHPAVDADGLAALTALATFANRQGRCWPSQTTLAARLKRSRAWVNKTIARLAEAGLLTVRDRWSENGGRLSSLYILTLEPAPAAPVATIGAPVIQQSSPCAVERHEQLEPEHKPDSLSPRNNGVTPTEDWTPTDEDLAWATARHGDVDLERHIAGFRLRCRAHGYRYRDIGAAWRAWLSEDAAAGKAPAAGKSSNQSVVVRGQPRQAAAQHSLNAWLAAAARLQSASV